MGRPLCVRSAAVALRLRATCPVLLVPGLLYGLFMMGVGLRFTGLMRCVFVIGGVLVGVFPMDVNLETHGQVALGFFEGSLVLMTIFALYVGLARQTAFPRWLALVPIPMIVSNAAFVYRGC
jgi:hypothetical protein